MNTTNPAFLMQTAAPVAVHQCEVISVIATELFACFNLGVGMAMSIVCETTRSDLPVDSHANEALDRMDINWTYVSDSLHNFGDGVEEPRDVDYIAAAALDSVKSWAADINAFYNSDLLKQMVYKLCSDYFHIGLMARPDTFTAFYADLCNGLDEAMKACSKVDRA